MNYAMTHRLTKHIEENRSIYMFTTILLIMGIIFGAILVNSLGLTQKDNLYLYLDQFFGQVKEGHFATSKEMFVHSFAQYAKYAGLMWILGLSIIGLPFILILLFLKGMVTGFTVGFLVQQMGPSGFFLAFVSILPQNIIAVPVMIFVSTMAVSFSLMLIRQLFIKRRTDPIFPAVLKSCVYLGAAMILLALASGFESFLSPPLMRMVIEWVGRS